MSKKTKRANGTSREQRERRSEKQNAVLMDPGAQRGIISIAIFALMLITIFSLFGWAGDIGEIINAVLTRLVGVGRYVIPIFLLLVVYLLLSQTEYAVHPIYSVGVGCLAVAIFGLIDIIQPQAGGYIGSGITYLFRRFASVGVAVVILVALLIIAILILFNTPLDRLVQHIPARTLLGKALRFTIALFSSAKHRWAIAKEHALATLETTEGMTLDAEGEDDSLSATAEMENDAQTVFSTHALGATAAARPQKPKQLELVHVPKRHRHIEIPLELLSAERMKPTSGDIDRNKEIIRKTLENFGLDVEMGPVNIGPTVTQYSFRPSSGVKVAQVVSLQNDLALALAAHPIRIEAPIPGKSLVGVEVPNIKPAHVGLRELLETDEFRHRRSSLTLALGRDVSGNVFTADIGQMPHMLIAGATGSGKSVCINTVILSLLYQNGPDDLKLILVDPKRVEFTMYNETPHLLTPVITDIQKTINALQWTVNEMDRRYEVLAHAKHRDISSYNASHQDEAIPYLVFIIDELADLMATAPREVETAIVRLAQMARAVGIHLVLATQRPSVDVITGLIKANITTRCAFSTASIVDSRTIIDMAGAEKLLGKGDMLFMSTDSAKPRRLQGAYVTEAEMQRVVQYLKDKAEPIYEEEVVDRHPQPTWQQTQTENGSEDELLPAAKKVIIESQKASASLLQRRLRIGYARAARLLDILEEQGFIGPADGAKPRELLGGYGTADIPQRQDDALSTVDHDMNLDPPETELHNDEPTSTVER